MPLQGSRVDEHPRAWRLQAPRRGRRGWPGRQGRLRPAVHARGRQRRPVHGRIHEPQTGGELRPRQQPFGGYPRAGSSRAVPPLWPRDEDLRRVQQGDGRVQGVRLCQLCQQGRCEPGDQQAGRVRLR